MVGGLVVDTYSVTAGAGTVTHALGAGKLSMSGAAMPPAGRLLGVNVRVPVGGGWTFATIRTVVFQIPDSGLPAGLPDDAFILYDSGVSGVPTPSDTISTFNDDVGANEQWFGRQLGIAHIWTTSAGAGTSSLVTTLHVATGGGD